MARKAVSVVKKPVFGKRKVLLASLRGEFSLQTVPDNCVGVCTPNWDHSPRQFARKERKDTIGKDACFQCSQSVGSRPTNRIALPCRGNIEWLGRRRFAQTKLELPLSHPGHRNRHNEQTRGVYGGWAKSITTIVTDHPARKYRQTPGTRTDMMISPKPRIRKIIQNLRNLTHKLNLAESSKTCETLPKTLAIHTRTRNSCPYPHGSRN